MGGLTKKHFKAIAEIINKKYKGFKEVNEGFEMREQEFHDLTEDLSNYFKTQNPLFNENQFKKVCLE